MANIYVTNIGNNIFQYDRNALPLYKISYTSAIKTSFIAFGLHYLCIR